ncbi:hypothetical protein [Cupriavidus pauculus]|uniref:Uncharacterized protein n=1 Tax=Cupriavidus pauculus TaxID=82633 RepID=A0A3G8H4U7_9BURK|nr:hypothetical protein [Cupriavidus pauculus]AZG15551.1 hypothetical protein EHF44_18920 [Cupriavidus pauculus]
MTLSVVAPTLFLETSRRYLLATPMPAPAPARPALDTTWQPRVDDGRFSSSRAAPLAPWPADPRA